MQLSLVDVLPIERLEVISNDLDILSFICFTSTCRLLWNTLNYKDKRCSRPSLIFMEAQTNLSLQFPSLNALAQKIAQWVHDHSYTIGQLYMPKKFHHTRTLSCMELSFTKNSNGRCTFIIKDSNCPIPLYQLVQLVYEKEYKRYRWSKLNNSQRAIKIPTLLLFIAFRTLFNIHGYEYVSCFQDIHAEFDTSSIPVWFQKIVCSQSFPGHIFDELVDGIVEIDN